MSPAETQCPRCGAPVEPLQEYCVECGHRLRGGGTVPALASGWTRRLRWYPGDWVWPSLLALVVATISAAGAIWWTRAAGGAPATTIVGDTAPLPTVPTQTTPTAPAATVPTQTRPTTTTRSRTAPARRALIEWPQGRNAWTLVIVSVPTSAGRPAAVGRAREAIRAGLSEVGVLDSSEFASLHPGYYVIFAGIYPTIGAAQDAVARAAELGYENAYARRVTS